MEIKKTFSHIEGQAPQSINIDLEDRAQAPHSEYGLSTLFKSKQRVPMVLHSSLRNKASQYKSNKPEQEQNKIKQSKVGSVIRSGVMRVFKSSKDNKVCEICQGELVKAKNKNLQVYMCICEHKQNYCESCLHHYVIYKVKTFEEVHCPHEGCPAILDVNTNFFKQLPADIQKNYRKLSQFYLTAQNPNMKMCPKQNCEGILQTTTQNVMVCNGCQYTCCAKCLLSVHEDECDTQEVKFFESNLHYRQCKKCKFIIQKNQGCNHMTCRCGNQFCYVCGQPWAPAHYGNHDQSGRLIPVPEGQAAANNLNYDPCCECGCIDECFGERCGCILKLPIKLLLLLLFIFMMLLILVSRDLLTIFGLGIICILAGTFGFSFQILSQLQDCMCLMGVLFFPITMIVGIGKAFRQIYCDVVPDLCRQYWQIFCNGIGGICEI